MDGDENLELSRRGHREYESLMLHISGLNPFAQPPYSSYKGQRQRQYVISKSSVTAVGKMAFFA